MTLRVPQQLALPVPNTWGGHRPRAGRKPRTLRAGVPHRRRPYHDRTHPVHITLRAAPGLPSFRGERVLVAVREGIRRGQRDSFRICHFSVQGNHVHLLVEAKGRQVLSRGIQGLAIRMARAVNRVLRRTGKVWGDRYHRHDLETPREVRHALVYVLMNFKKHGVASRTVDPCSSGPWFTGWRDRQHVPPADAITPVTPPLTWLLGAGWCRYGLIDAREAPSHARRG